MKVTWEASLHSITRQLKSAVAALFSLARLWAITKTAPWGSTTSRDRNGLNSISFAQPESHNQFCKHTTNKPFIKVHTTYYIIQTKSTSYFYSLNIISSPRSSKQYRRKDKFSFEPPGMLIMTMQPLYLLAITSRKIASFLIVSP